VTVRVRLAPAPPARFISGTAEPAVSTGVRPHHGGAFCCGSRTPTRNAPSRNSRQHPQMAFSCARPGLDGGR